MRLLIVEDEPTVRTVAERALTRQGYTVLTADNGEEALEIMERNPGAYDIIISDVSMPVMTGPEMLQEAEPAMIGNAKVLFLSGYAPESFSHMLEQYPVHYMSKPVTMEQLVGRVFFEPLVKRVADQKSAPPLVETDDGETIDRIVAIFLMILILLKTLP